MSEDRKILTGYSWAKTLKHLRNKKSLRPLEKVVKNFEERLSELERKYEEDHAPKKRGRPKGSKNKGIDNE
jgi:hypothetical protein